MTHTTSQREAYRLPDKLSPGQLFHLGVLCEAHDEVMRSPEPITRENVDAVVRRHVAVQAPIARMLFDAGVVVQDFGPRGYANYHPAFMLTPITMSPDDFPPGSGGHEILLAAGIRSADPSTWPLDENEFHGEGIA